MLAASSCPLTKSSWASSSSCVLWVCLPGEAPGSDGVESTPAACSFSSVEKSEELQRKNIHLIAVKYLITIWGHNECLNIKKNNLGKSIIHYFWENCFSCTKLIKKTIFSLKINGFLDYFWITSPIESE